MLNRKGLSLLYIAIFLSTQTVSAQICAPGPPSGTASNAQHPVRLSLSNLDPKVDPCVDFYRYACGGWIDANPLPADEVFWDTTEMLQRWNESVLRDVLNAAQANDPNRSVVQREIGDYYAACMDEMQIETHRLEPVQPELDRIAAIKDMREFAVELGRLHRILFRITDTISSVYAAGSGQPLWGVSSLPDFNHASLTLALVDQGGLGLPDRNYYLRNDADSIQVRKYYREHIQRTLELAETTSARDSAARVLEIETALARASADPVTHRDFRNLNHKFSHQELEELTPSFSWQNYLATVGAPNSPQYTVTIPEFFKAANQLLQAVSLADWRLYLRWHLLKNVSPMLNRAFADEHFNFYDKILQGQQQQSPRWQRCLQATDRDLGDALGLAFVERTFSARAKEAASGMAVGLEAAMADDITRLRWMSAPTKQEALSKLHKLEIKVGYPEKWRDYSTVRIGRDSWAENALRTGEFEYQRRIARIGKPADRDDWSITTPTVDAYYSVQQNRMVVPAGFMGPPFFDGNMDDAVNFGGAGAGIGHELTHAFDNHGREFDAEGNLRDWWTPEDSRRFEEHAECVSKQYSQYVALGDVKVNGELTLGENLADAAGLRVAYEALESRLEKKGGIPPKVDGLTPEQRFFLSYGLQWCGNITPEMLRKLASNNPHSPPKYRVNGVVSNMSEFQRAFGCKKGQPMVRENACRVW